MNIEFNLQNIVIYLAIINTITFLTYFKDKKIARNGGWRISEKTLLLMAFFGGTPAAYYAQKKFRHKTKKSSFKAKFFMIIIFQIILLTCLTLKTLGFA